MLELPELEIITKEISNTMTNEKITSAYIDSTAVISDKTQNLPDTLTGRTITKVKRQGLSIIISLDNKYELILYPSQNAKIKLSQKCKESIFQLITDKKHTIIVSDKNAYMKIFYLAKNEKRPLKINKIGLDALDKNLTPDYVTTKINEKHIKTNIKTVLMDQRVMSGLGQLYSDAILLKMKIHPLTKCDSISTDTLSKLLSETQKILNLAIEEDEKIAHECMYTASENFENSFSKQIYMHAPCPICGTKLLSIIINSKKCNYCPKCQERNN